MPDFQQEKLDILEVCKEMYAKGLLVGTDGNASIRVGADQVLITASGFCKGKIGPEHITLVDMRGRVLEGLNPARDIRMHLAVYRERPQCAAVLHAHPPYTTGFSMSCYDNYRCALPEVLFTLRDIGFTEYAVPISVDVARGVTRCLRAKPLAQAVVLANHGALTFGASVFDAFYKMQTLELYFTATVVSKLIGHTRYLNPQEVAVVERLLDGVDPDEIVPPDENGL